MQPNIMKLFVWTVILVVAASIVAGFFVIGSPQSERMRKFDQQRVENLTILQSEIINYWRQKNQLPEKLDVLKNDITGFIPPADPENNTPYDYRVIDKLSFELCADFKISSKNMPQPVIQAPPTSALYYEQNQNWPHGIGHTCFTRIIDPDLYKNAKLPPTY